MRNGHLRGCGLNIIPNPPLFRAEECLSEGNIITLVWQPCPGIGIDYYTLEIDDGAGGAFRVS
ncbi:unnamed protein product [Rodentolepis nana]|uniref:Fibronectin type-III domain-containing protein n=1 Tax=Rodentolepis nana TaxID=102285 RepID=A0A0R3TIR3_RODNA|nr:unnamed protein product [Rodentolepis nana]